MANGIYTNTEIMDSVIVDLNDMVKELVGGQYIQACCIVAQMSQKLLNLRNTINNDLKNREKTIETLKEQLRNAGQTVTDMTPQEFIDTYVEKDGDNNGSI